ARRSPGSSLFPYTTLFRSALIVIVLGGIYGGLFTPTEAAAVSAVYAFFVAVCVYKDITLRDVPKILLTSASMSAMLLYIITNARSEEHTSELQSRFDLVCR